MLDVEVSGPGNTSDIQSDMIQIRGLERTVLALAGLGARCITDRAAPSPMSRTQADDGKQTPLEVFNDRSAMSGCMSASSSGAWIKLERIRPSSIQDWRAIADSSRLRVSRKQLGDHFALVQLERPILHVADLASGSTPNAV